MERCDRCTVQRWNSKLAELAQTWSTRCDFEHGQPPFDAAAVGYKQLGQNLYVNSDASKGVVGGVQAWFDEKSDYNYDSLTCAPGKACGHYTQVCCELYTLLYTWGEVTSHNLWSRYNLHVVRHRCRCRTVRS